MQTHLIKVTILYDPPHWKGIFERKDAHGYAVARTIFGSEPTDSELYEFVKHNYQTLQFSAPQTNFQLVIKRKNPKRLKREAKKEVQANASPIQMTRAQEALKTELEKNKKIKKQISKTEKLKKEKLLFALKQEKKKLKKRGR